MVFFRRASARYAHDGARVRVKTRSNGDGLGGDAEGVGGDARAERGTRAYARGSGNRGV